MVVVDDHPSFRRSAKRLLTSAGYDVVGEAATGAEAIAVAKALDPDVVLLDVLLPDCTGFDLVDQLVTPCGRPLVVLVSSRAESEFAGRLIASSAHAFMTKSDLSTEALARVIP